MVVQLVKKDLVYLATSLKSTLGIVITFAFCFPMINVGIGCIVPALVCYIGFYSTLAYEERNKMDILNLSLPVNRKAICLAKYIEVLIFIVGGCILSSLGMLLMQRTSIILLEGGIYGMIPVMLAVALVYSAIIIPCVFYFGTLKARYVLLLFYVVIFILGNSLESTGFVNFINYIGRIGDGYVNLIGVLIALVLFILSYSISLRIWRYKEV